MNTKITYEAPEVEVIEMVDDIMNDSAIILPDVPMEQ